MAKAIQGEPLRTRTNDSLGIVDSLVQLSFLVLGVLEGVAEAEGLSLIQLRLLGILRDREPAMAELAAFLALDKSSVTGLVARAEQRGLLKRVADQEDGRAVRVLLSAQGKALAKKLGRRAKLRAQELTVDLSELERDHLAELASRVIFARRKPHERE